MMFFVDAHVLWVCVSNIRGTPDMGSFEYPVFDPQPFIRIAVLTYSAILYNFAVCIVSVGLDGFAQSVSHQMETIPKLP